MSELRSLYDQRNRTATNMRTILDRADKAKRQLTAEERSQYDTMETRLDSLNDRIREAEGDVAHLPPASARFAATALDDPNDPAPEFSRPPEGNEIRCFRPGQARTFRSMGIRESKREDRHFETYLKLGRLGLPGDVRQQYDKRALQADLDPSGGYLIPPAMSARIIMALDDIVVIRRHSTVMQVAEAMSLGVPSLDSDPDDPDWSVELRTGTEDESMEFGNRELYPHPLAKRIKASKTLVRRSSMAEGLIRGRLTYKFGVSEENAFLNGNGANKPLGVMVASSDGIDTDRDVSDGNKTTTIGADGLINAKFALKSQYRKRARWVFSRDAVKQIRKLKDGEGNYLWRLGIASDRPDTILDLPFEESEFMPSTFNSGQYVGILGDFSYYWVADALSMQIQVLTELYAETNQNGYIGRKETDGMPVLAEAFARVTLG